MIVRTLLLTLAFALVAAPAFADEYVNWSHAGPKTQAASAALERDQYKRAEALARKAIARGETSPYPSWVLSSALVGQERLDEAAEVLVDAHARHPSARTLSSLGLLQLELGRRADAEASAFAAIALDPGVLEGWGTLTRVRIAQGRQDELAVELDRERRRRVRNELACMEAIGLASQELLGRAEAAITRCARGGASSWTRRAERAIERLRTASTFGDPRALRAREALFEYRVAEAVEQATELIEDPDVPIGTLLDAYAIRSRAHTLTKRHEQAREDGARAVAVAMRLAAAIVAEADGSSTHRLNRSAAGRLVILIAEIAPQGSDALHNGALQVLRDGLGDGFGLRAAEVYAWSGENDSSEGWSRLAAALAMGGEPNDLTAAAFRLARIAAREITPSTRRVILQQGTPFIIDAFAESLYRADAHGDCVDVLTPLLEPSEGTQAFRAARFAEERKRVADDATRLAYACSVRGGELDGAWEIAATNGETVVDEHALMHAIKLQASNRGGESIDVLRAADATESDDPDVAAAARMLLLRCLLDLDRLDEALIEARRPGRPDYERYQLGIALSMEDRLAEAIELLDLACPGIEEIWRKDCESDLANLRWQARQ